MLVKLACISLEIKLKLKSKFSRKKKVKLENVNESQNLTYETTFHSFDDNIDPWLCCSDNNQDVRYSCVLEMETHVAQCCQEGDSHELHYACTDVTRTTPAPSINLGSKQTPCCHPQCQFWDLDSDLLLVESSG